MEGIGERLKRKREEMGLSIEQAAEATKFRPEMIEAVEEDRPGQFSARVYQDGFIRGYARMLGLDGDALVREQKTEEERAQEALRGIRIRPPSTPKLRRTAVVVIVVAVIGVLASILIDRLVTRPREPKQESATREAVASDSVERGSTLAGSRKMAYIPGPSREVSPGETGSDAVQELRQTESAPGTPISSEPSSSAGEEPTRPGPNLPAVSPATAKATDGPTGAVQAQGVAGGKSLEVAAGRHSVYLILASGEQVIYDGWVYGGTRKVFRGDDFTVVSLSGTEGVSIALDGRPVTLPETGQAGQKSIGDWPVR